MNHHRLPLAILFACSAVVLALTGCGSDHTRLTLASTPAKGIQVYHDGTALWVVNVTVTPSVNRPVSVTATSVEGVTCEVVPAMLNGSGTVEVLAHPSRKLAGRTVNVAIRAKPQSAAPADSATCSAGLTVPLQIIPGHDGLGQTARTKLAPFLPYLATQHPEFGIDANTTWDGWVTAPGILVVMWYSFLSSDWEALIQWHVMIPPYNWTHVYLRRRGSTQCVWAGEITTDGAPVQEVTPPDVFPRFEAPWNPTGAVAAR